MSERNIIFSGLPESGKTTFLAALWFYIFNSLDENEYECASLDGIEIDYLNAISRKWASCEDVVRTNQNKIEEVTFNIVHKLSGSSLVIRIPDLSGETFNTQFEDREWEEEFDDIIDKTFGMLLFVDPRDKKNKPRLITQENQYYRFFGEEIINAGPEVPWTESLAPSQVKLVDFLQMIDFHKPNTICKISIIVSCWDEIVSENNPENWCKNEVPLLHQYLSSKSDIFTVKYFGVSSQGGSYDNVKSKMELLGSEPLKRIIITDGINKTNNILSPILWITDDDTD